MSVQYEKKPCCSKLVGEEPNVYSPYHPMLGKLEKEGYKNCLPAKQVREVPSLKADKFPKDLLHQYFPPQHYVKGFDILPLYHKEWREDLEVRKLSFLQNQHLACKWEEFKRGLPVAEKRIINIPVLRDFHFMNYYVRHIRPDVKGSYQLKLKPGPKLIGNIQCPIPADNHLRYRECY